MNPFEIAIWSALGIFGYITTHTVVERLLFHFGCRIARRQSLEQFCGQLRDFRSLSFTQPLVDQWKNGHRSVLRPEPLGWLVPLLVEANGTRSKLRHLLHNFESTPNRFASFQATMVNVGASLGLMGTVLAFVQVAGNENFAKLMPLAFETTLAGLLISIPASLVYGLLTPRSDLILDQVDLVMDAIDASEKEDEISPLEEVADVVRDELTQVATLLRSIANSQASLVSQQQELVTAPQSRILAERPMDELESAELVPSGASANGKKSRLNGHARHLSKGETNETETR